MRVLDLSFNEPEMNLAFDEVLLDSFEEGRIGETLRFWESPRPFVVLGVAQALRQHVREQACTEDAVPILRRCSGGGCVVQGPGCLNFAVVLSHEKRPEIRTVRGSYCHILERIAEALQERGVSARHKGISDLAVCGRKVSGNAQRRRKHGILHHGTLLYRMDCDSMARYLREPDERPQYRGDRTHSGFACNIPLTPRDLRQAVCKAFGVADKLERPHRWEIVAARDLALTRYADSAWNRRR